MMIGQGSGGGEFWGVGGESEAIRACRERSSSVNHPRIQKWLEGEGVGGGCVGGGRG